MAEKMYGFSGSGLFGYSPHDGADTPAARRSFARVPFADVGWPSNVPEGLSDERVLFSFLTFSPTGFMAS